MPKVADLAPFEPRRNYCLRDIDQVTILIKTLERKDHLINLLLSIAKYQFRGPIIIADDSKSPYGNEILQIFPSLNIDYISLPYDTGTAEGRNRMLNATKTKYFLLCDDDFIFDKRTRIPLMFELLKKNNLDILGGVFRQFNRKTRLGNYFIHLNKYLNKHGWIIPSRQLLEYYAAFDVNTNKIVLKKVEYINPVTPCDLTHNFFLAKTAAIKKFGGWNPILKGGEHQNFFIRAKLAKLKIGTTRLCGVIHDQWTENSVEYKALRNRGSEFQMMALQEFGINKLDNYREVLGENFGI